MGAIFTNAPIERVAVSIGALETGPPILFQVQRGNPTGIQLCSTSAAQFYDTMTSMTRMTTINRHSHDRGTWAAAEARARFSELIDRALADGPQTITRKGKNAVVVVSNEEWQRKTKRKGNLAEFFAASPLHGSDLKIKRSKDGPRELEL